MLASSWSGDDGKLGREEELYVDSHGRPEGSDCPIFDKPSAYGEVTPSGARQLFDTMGVHTASDAVFADLGSGAGRLVVQAWLELPMVQRAIGVELAPSRHATAVSAWDSLVESGATAQFAHGRAAPEFRLASMLETDLSAATHVYVASLCMGSA